TPHRWTPYYSLAANRMVVQPDRTKWDYKHQVRATEKLPPWRVFLWVKAIEAIAQLRPKALLRILFHPDAKIRHAIRWYYRMGRRVWFHEIRQFLLFDRPRNLGVPLVEFYGAPQEAEEEAMAK